MSQIFNLVFTSWPILIFATYDEEYTREAFLRNPFLYTDGPKNAHMNGLQFWNWVTFTLFQSTMLFYIVFVASANDPATIYAKKEHSSGGIGTDMWLLGVLLYFIVVAMVNNQLFLDSNSLNWIHISILILSTLSFFLFYWVVNLINLDPQAMTFREFYRFWMYPGFYFVIFFFMFS